MRKSTIQAVIACINLFHPNLLMLCKETSGRIFPLISPEGRILCEIYFFNYNHTIAGFSASSLQTRMRCIYFPTLKLS